MRTYLALLRGINVGGKHRIAMAELRDLLGTLGLRNVKTYIQSGNVCFQTSRKSTAALAKDIESAIDEQFGFRPRTLVIRPEELDRALSENPFPQALDQPQTLHIFFLASSDVRRETAAFEQLRAETEEYALVDNKFYLYAPDGIARSKLASRVEGLLEVGATARNLKTVQKLQELARSFLA